MDLSHPEYAVLGESRARVLHRLSLLAQPASGRRIHELSGVRSLLTTQRILADLVEIGIVNVERVGSANAYSVNRQHVLWQPIEEILAVRAQLQSKIVEIVDRYLSPSVRGTALFGSLARGEAGELSDIDILIVWKGGIDNEVAVRLLDTVAEEVRRLTGNSAQMVSLTVEELARLVEQNDPLVASLREDAQPLTGMDVRPLLRGTG